MTMQAEGASSRQRPAWPIAVGCAALAVCLGLAGIAGAGALWFSRRAAGSGRQPAVEYILDASPRMALPAQGAQASRLVVAQGVLAEIVRPADPGVSAGLRVFGSGALPDACRDTDLLVPLGTANQGEISDRVQALQAGAAADAAMAEAMVAAIRDLADPSGPHTLVVVTGGSDSCNPEAGELIAREAERAGIDLQLFVVGYQVSDEDAAAIKGTVEESAGTYLAALTEDDLRAILEAIQAYIDEGTTALLEQAQALATPETLATAVAAGGFTPAPPQPTAQPGEATPTGAAATAGPGEPTAAPTAGGTAGYEAQSACDHPYFPLRQGATWTYSSEFGDYTWTVTEVTGDLQNATATLQMAVLDGTITYHWNCSAEGVVSYDFGNIAVSGAEGGMQMDIVSSEGAWLLPADEMEAGASWTHSYSLQMASPDGLTITSEVSQSFTAAGLETTETEAGSFESLRVDGTAVNTTSIAGISTTSTDSSVTYWLAYGIGMVRSDSVTDGEVSSAVLVSYSIP
ncbi:MAG: hypothetical protein IT318_10540 [Anaerolineales bacterium]|nr:hypothetical protein [Anaerolineales bacterium]